MTDKLFNSNFENSLRLLILLDEFVMPKSVDMLYDADFMSAYGATFHLSQNDLNGENPYMFSEFASRRGVVRMALKELVLDGFVVPVKLDKGFAYTISSDGEEYCQSLESDYATGNSVKPSFLQFEDGVNIIYGASNSGKSYVINCINFMFYGEIPFTKEATGYNKVSMLMESDDGYSIEMTREIVDGSKEETGAGKVSVVSNVPGINSGDYTNNADYSKVILRLFASFSALWLLLTGDDLKEILPEETKEEREKKATQKAGVIIYLNRKIAELTDRRKNLEQNVAEAGDTDIEEKINNILAEIAEIEQQIRDASAESQELLKRIYTVSSKLEEAKFLKDRYQSLRSQYSSDIKRLRFIADGKKKAVGHKRLAICPFCEAEMKNQTQEQESYITAATAELARISLQMKDLEEAEGVVSREIATLQNEMQNLNTRNIEITTLVNRQFKPRAAELKITVEFYKRVLIYQQQLFALDAMSAELNIDVSDKQKEEDSEAPKYNPRKMFLESGKRDTLSENFEKMVQDCEYPGRPSARIDIDILDAVVGGKYKKNQGKGYRAS